MLNGFTDVKKNDGPSSEVEENEFDLFPTTITETPNKNNDLSDDSDNDNYDMIKESTALQKSGVKLKPGQLFFASCAILDKMAFYIIKLSLPLPIAALTNLTV
ncbi:MAG: hypothetical protein GY821_13300 [Gammaproteobacteria bacterium]|nr:hypothetical protein [Gammaproteobacteria bacterium]